MRRRTIPRFAFLVVMLPCLMAAAVRHFVQPQQNAQSPDQQVPASLEGTVVRAGSAPPLAVPRARVVLSSSPARGVNTPTTLTVLSDENGRFQLRNIPPGAYNLMATRDGYVRPSRAIVLLDGDSLTNVVLEMTPTGAISGRMRNRAGEPVGNVTVQAQRYFYREGRRVLTPVQSALTNDLGEFRLYYLPPGRYIVSATPDSGPQLVQGPPGTTLLTARSVPGMPVIGPTGALPEDGRFLTARADDFISVGLLPASATGRAFVPVYFPGTMDLSASTSIDLAPGMDFRNADFIVEEARASRVRGRVVSGITGEPVSGATLAFLPLNSDGTPGTPSRRNGSVGPDGTFELAAVPPGTYDLIAMLGTIPREIAFAGRGYPGGGLINPGPPRDASTRRDFSAEPAGIRLAARLPLVVAGSDIDNVVVTVQTGNEIRGRVEIEGASLEESRKQLDGVIVQLMPDSYDFETAPMPAVVRPDGTFTIVGALPGNYQIALMGASNMPIGLAYIKSASMGGVDAINPRFVIEKEPLGELEIVVSTARGNVEVSVVDEKREPAASATVVFVPDPPLRRHYDLYQSARANDRGIVRMSLPAGDYTVYAFADIEPNSWWDSEVMQKYAGQGTPVRVEPSGRHALSLKSIPSP